MKFSTQTREAPRGFSNRSAGSRGGVGQGESPVGRATMGPWLTGGEIRLAGMHRPRRPSAPSGGLRVAGPAQRTRAVAVAGRWAGRSDPARKACPSLRATETKNQSKRMCESLGQLGESLRRRDLPSRAGRTCETPGRRCRVGLSPAGRNGWRRVRAPLPDSSYGAAGSALLLEKEAAVAESGRPCLFNRDMRLMGEWQVCQLY